MSRKRKRKDVEVLATGDDGKIYTVEQWTTVIISETFGSGLEEADGLRELRTSCGEELSRLGKGHYQVVAAVPGLGPTELKSDDPEAP